MRIYLLRAFQRGFFHLLSANVLLGFLGFGSQLLVVKYLSPVELGQIRTMQSFLAVALVVGSFGFNTAVLKLCSENRPTHERAYIFKKNFLYSLVPTTGVLLGLFVCARLNLLSPDPAISRLLPFYMFLLPASSAASMSLVYLQSQKRIQLLASVQAGIRIFGFVLLIVLTAYLGIHGYILASLAGAYLSLVPLYWIVRDVFPARVPAVDVLSISKPYALWSVAANGVLSIGQYIDIFLLNFLVSDRALLGYYGLATLFILGANYVTSTVQDITTPYFSESSHDGQLFVRMMRKYQGLLVFLSAAVACILFFLVPWIIDRVYGPPYAEASLIFRILTFKYFLWSSYAVIGVALLGLGKIQYNFLVVAISVPISAAITFAMTKLYSVHGTALAQVLAQIVSLGLTLFVGERVIRRQFHLSFLSSTGSISKHRRGPHNEDTH